MDIKMERMGYDPLYNHTAYRCPSCGELRYYPGDVAFVEERPPVCYCKSKIPDVESTEKQQIDIKKFSDRVRELYRAFRDRGFDKEEAFDLTKIIALAEVQHELSKM